MDWSYLRVCIVVALIACGCRQSHELKLGMIKDDSLGMSLAAYQKAHQDFCQQIGSERDCIAESTYAGLPTKKMARFLDGRLFQIVYTVDNYSRSDLLKALIEKYGQPHDTVGGVDATWTGGMATMEYKDFKTGASVTFSLNGLLDESAKRAEAQRAAGARNDQ